MTPLSASPPATSYAARVLLGVLLVPVAVLTALLVVPADAPAPAPVASAARARPDPRVGSALAVLRAWDARRLAAWRHSDATALRRLYPRGSPAARRDLRLLRAYADQGLVLRELRTQVFAVHVVRRTPGLVRLRVFDRVAGGVLARAGERVPLRSSRPVRRRLELRRVDHRWVLASSTPVSGWGPGPRAGRR